MGDGYVQRIRDGINSDLPTVALTWTALYSTEATYINDFFKTRYGVTAFEYQPPHIDYSAQAKFIVQDWSVTKTHGSSFDVTATLQQVADPT
jgi:phage-related protein